MPAVDPARLKREVDQLVLAFDEPARFVEGVLDLFAFHADRVRRPGAHAAAHQPVRTLRVPRPVVAALATATRQAAQASSAAWEVAQRLWDEGSFETQTLAVAAVGARSDARVAAWVSACLDRRLDDRLRSSLADEGMSTWRRSDPEAFLALSEDWISHGDLRHQELAFLALEAACRKSDPEVTGQVLDMLYRLPSTLEPDVATARLQLLGILAQRHPAETAAYLIHEYERGAPESGRPIRQLLPQFPNRLQAQLRRTLGSNA